MIADPCPSTTWCTSTSPPGQLSAGQHRRVLSDPSLDEQMQAPLSTHSQRRRSRRDKTQRPRCGIFGGCRGDDDRTHRARTSMSAGRSSYETEHGSSASGHRSFYEKSGRRQHLSLGTVGGWRLLALVDRLTSCAQQRRPGLVNSTDGPDCNFRRPIDTDPLDDEPLSAHEVQR